MYISKQQGNSLMEKQSSDLNLNTNSQENSCNDMDVEQAIFTNAVCHKSNKRKSLTQSKKKSHAAMCKEIELQIMDRGDVSIEMVTEQFLIEGSEIVKCDGLYTADDYIPTPKNIPADLLHSFDQSKHYIYNKKEEVKKESSKQR